LSFEDITWVAPTTLIVSFEQRSGAENAAFALDGFRLAGHALSVSLFDVKDPQVIMATQLLN
jgi:hypothetical protein